MKRRSLAGVLFCLLAASCSKTGTELQDNTNSTSKFIDSAHSWFLSEVQDAASSGDNTLNWAKTQSMTFSDGIRIVEVPLKKQEAVSAKIRTGDNIAKVRPDSNVYTHTSLIIYHSPSAGFYYAVMKIVGDDGYINRKTIKRNSFMQLDRTFTGVILLQKWDGSFIKGSKYNRGKRLSPLRVSTGNGANQRMDCIRTTVDFYQQVCRGNWCGDMTYLYSTSTLSCVFTADPPQEGPIDYKEPPSDGGGGYNPPPVEEYEQTNVRFDKSFADSFPCALNIVNQLRLIRKFMDMVEPFSKDLKPDLVWSIDSTMTWGPINYLMGKNASGIGTSNSSSTIYLNPQGLINASKLMIAATMIHEVIHANANYYLDWKKAGEIPAASWITAAFDVLKLQDDSLLNGNARDHQAIMNALFNDMFDILKTWGGANYTDDEYKMALLYGLENAGQHVIGAPNAPQPTPQQIAEVHNLFQTLMVTHNITPDQLNTFNNANIKSTPAAKKLPKVGC